MINENENQIELSNQDSEFFCSKNASICGYFNWGGVSLRMRDNKWYFFNFKQIISFTSCLVLGIQSSNSHVLDNP